MSGSGDRPPGSSAHASVDPRAELSGDGSLGRIEHLITVLVRSAPVADPAVVEELREHLYRVGSPLARSIARVVELVADQRVAPGIALPPLAMACATLVDGVRGTLTDRELEAARYEIETLLPVPEPPPVIAVPHVPVSALRKRRS